MKNTIQIIDFRIKRLKRVIKLLLSCTPVPTTLSIEMLRARAEELKDLKRFLTAQVKNSTVKRRKRR